MRGEYTQPQIFVSFLSELPPRARRIHSTAEGQVSGRGTTSACAENTDFLSAAGGLGGNYLRVRGEYLRRSCLSWLSWELPPRARRILMGCQVLFLWFGTTSACAENTAGICEKHHRRRNYLRVRGEYRLRVGHRFCSSGTTSACAENTGFRVFLRVFAWNYLRVRGEYA